MNSVLFHDLHLIDYKQCWDLQEKMLEEISAVKVANRELPDGEKVPTQSHLIFCEHPHVFTLGKTGDEQNLLADAQQLKEINATFYKINRGGDITYHGPGQLVGYPILDLDNFFTDIHRYLRTLEEVIIKTIGEFGLKGDRYEGYTGVWLDPHDPVRARKICAMGVRTSRWITMHGWALNVNPDLSYFNRIVPCGISDKAVTSMEKELGKKVDMEEVKKVLKKYFEMEFECVLK
ncbi:MAG TPA: lipoyl(octanoyl) transferase LipB [Bacteroidia bacterium]|jgi:lipoyl(octanoyl) transferase|nr:lipoyl(octanoyl) transferase LipB [Bacteroidia bacterium]